MFCMHRRFEKSFVQHIVCSDYFSAISPHFLIRILRSWKVVLNISSLVIFLFFVYIKYDHFHLIKFLLLIKCLELENMRYLLYYCLPNFRKQLLNLPNSGNTRQCWARYIFSEWRYFIEARFIWISPAYQSTLALRRLMSLSKVCCTEIKIASSLIVRKKSLNCYKRFIPGLDKINFMIYLYIVSDLNKEILESLLNY